MRDDVVQLAGDPGALGGHGHLGLGLALLLQPLVALDQLGVVGPPGAQGVAQHPGQDEGDDHEDGEEGVVDVVAALVHAVPQEVERRGRQPPAKGGARDPAGDLARGHRVEDHEHRDVPEAGDDAGAQLEQARPEGEPEHPLRPPAAQGQGRAQREDDGNGDDLEGPADVGLAHDVQHRDPEEEHSPEAVDARRVSAEEVVEALHVTQRRERR